MTKWTINGRFAAQPVTGVQRYAREIVGAMDALLTNVSDLVVEVAMPPATTFPIPLKNITLRTVGSRQGHLWEQRDLPRGATGGILSLANTGPLFMRRQIVCIHDANTRVCPESYSVQFRALYRTLHPWLGRSAGRVSTVSQHAATDLVRFGIAERSKIFVAPNGHEHALRWNPRHTDATRAAAGPGTIVVLGSPAPHKNISLLLDLAPKLSEHGLSLAIAGMTDASVFAARGPGVGAPPSANVRWLGRISDEALAALLADSLCLAFPSLTEGFGLPPLEAMARGCPIVVSDRASLPEICGPDALYAPPDQPQHWLAHFRALQTDPGSRTRQIARGLAQAQRFSWARTAATYLEEMRTMR